MSFAERGVIEGFYDRLWTWSERRRFATEVAATGFTTYVYAPKEDRLQNTDWRTPYPPEHRGRLASFVEHCRSVGLRAWLGLRPVGMSYADDQDAERVVARLRDAGDLGADGLLLLADDIPESLAPADARRFASLADAHLWLLERVRPAVAGMPFAFCPTEYHGPGGPYLRTLGAALPTDVALCWTGPRVCSSSITAGDAAAVGAVLGRKPLVWDNYPVNDASMTGELHIGPIRDRDPGLQHVTGGSGSTRRWSRKPAWSRWRRGPNISLTRPATTPTPPGSARCAGWPARRPMPPPSRRWPSTPTGR